MFQYGNKTCIVKDSKEIEAASIVMQIPAYMKFPRKPQNFEFFFCNEQKVCY